MKRISCVDQSLKVVELTVWGAQADLFESMTEQLNDKCILALQNVLYKNHEQFGRQLGFTDNTKIFSNPLELRTLREKFQQLKNFMDNHNGAQMETLSGGRGGGNFTLRTAD